jgi:hypothetical protein
MFEHFLAGELIFILLGKVFGFEITAPFIMFGAFCGYFPDLLSYFLNKHLRYDKWYHTHRDNLSHSLVLPIIFLFALPFFTGWKLAILISLAMLTHPLFDLFGIGWGVKLFLPFYHKIYKLFYRHKAVFVFKDTKSRDADIDKYETDDWFKRAYFSFHPVSGTPWWWAIFEWSSLAAAICLPLFYLVKDRF